MGSGLEFREPTRANFFGALLDI